MPAAIRKKLGLGPGSILEWVEMDQMVVVRRAGRLGWDDVRKALFPEGAPKARTLDELKEGPRLHARRRHARG